MNFSELEGMTLDKKRVCCLDVPNGLCYVRCSSVHVEKQTFKNITISGQLVLEVIVSQVLAVGSDLC